MEIAQIVNITEGGFDDVGFFIELSTGLGDGVSWFEGGIIFLQAGNSVEIFFENFL